jgi:hypothetical protein
MTNDKIISKLIHITTKKKYIYDLDILLQKTLKYKKFFKKNIPKNIYKKYKVQMKKMDYEINKGNGEYVNFICKDCINIINDIVVILA